MTHPNSSRAADFAKHWLFFASFVTASFVAALTGPDEYSHPDHDVEPVAQTRKIDPNSLQAELDYINAYPTNVARHISDRALHSDEDTELQSSVSDFGDMQSALYDIDRHSRMTGQCPDTEFRIYDKEYVTVIPVKNMREIVRYADSLAMAYDFAPSGIGIELHDRNGKANPTYFQASHNEEMYPKHCDHPNDTTAAHWADSTHTHWSRRSSVVFSAGILRLSMPEIKAALGHELGHHKMKHNMFSDLNDEYEADSVGFLMTKNSKAMLSLLGKLEQDRNKNEPKQAFIQEWKFIQDPNKFSHPPTLNRCYKIMKLAGEAGP